MVTTNDQFGPIASRWAVAEGLLADLKRWMPEYLAAGDRQEGRTAGATPAVASWSTRHAAVARPGERPPAVIVWLARVADYRSDPDGTVTGDLDLGVYILAGAKNTATTGEVLHRYVAAVFAVLLDHPTCDGLAEWIEPAGEDFTRTIPEKARVLQSAEIRLTAGGVVLGRRGAGPPPGSTPRDDPRPPWPPVPTVATTHVRVEATSHPNDPN